MTVKQKSKPATRMNNGSLRWLLGVLILIALLASAFLAGRASVTAVAEEPAASPQVLGPMGDQSRRDADDPFALGSVDAPVTMVIFSDYRCPFCARHSRAVEPELIDRYVESGQLRLEWRDLPIFGDASLLAARAGRAAAEQGLFWEFNRAVYAAAPQSGHHDLTEQKLIGFAEQVGVTDVDRFAAALETDEFDADIQADYMQAMSLGLSGTPSFVINGHPVVGAQPVMAFTTIIERELARR